MARPKKEIPPSTNHRITVRLTDDMYDVVLQDAKRAHLSLAEYVRQLILNRKIKYAPQVIHDDSSLLQELRKLNKLGTNMNQIARYLNEGGTMTNPLAKELREELLRIDEFCNRLNQELEAEYGNH